MTELSDFLASHHYTLALNGETLTGTGVDFLQREARNARYFLFGEDHGIGSSLKFATALFKTLQPSGYNAYVTEIGPVSAKHILALLNQPDSFKAFQQFYTIHPFAIPFDWLEEELALLQSGRETPGFELIGIDQEFILSPQLHLETLLALCTAGELKGKISEWLQAERAAVQEMYAGKPPDQLDLFMNLPLPPEWAALRNVFEAGRTSKALAIMDAVTASHEIYMHYKHEDYYLNNHVRGQLMKRYFHQAHQKQSLDTKYFIKLGANHIERGHSSMGIQDIGNFISELAVMGNTHSFHLFVLPVSGRQNMWLPFLPAEYKAAPIEANTQPQFAPLLESVQEKTGWQLYDLRPLRLRQSHWSQGSLEFKKFFQGYDAILLMYDVEPATLIAGEAA